MMTISELEQLSDLMLLKLLLHTYGEIIEIWRLIPRDQQPTTKQLRKIEKKEIYAMSITEVLEKRGSLPKSWRIQ